MRRFVLLVAALMATQGAAAADDSAPKSQIVPLYVSTNRPLAMLTIGDSAPMPVVFDTGTTENILDAGLAKRLGLKVVGRFNLRDDASGRSVEVPTAEAAAQLSGVPLDTNLIRLPDSRSGDEVGIFGPYSFGNRYVVVEAGLNRLRIIPKDGGFVPPGPGHAYKEDIPAAEIRIAGRLYDAVLDTGHDGALSLPANFVRSVPLKAPAKIVGKAVSALAEQDVFGGQLVGSVELGPYSLRDPDVAFVDTVINVGFPAIRHLTIVLDPANKLTWVLDPAREKPRWSDFTGRFGPRAIRLEHGKLIHQRDGRPPFALTYLGGDLFEMATGDRIQFFRKDGRVVRLELLTKDNRISPADRTS
jgi:predicted aspartyl protease